MNERDDDKSPPFSEPDWVADDPEFHAWVDSMPQKYWAKYDLGACRLGWHASRAQRSERTPTQIGAAIAEKLAQPELKTVLSNCDAKRDHNYRLGADSFTITNGEYAALCAALSATRQRIKGVRIAGGYVIVTPIGSGPEPARILADQIFELFPVGRGNGG